MSPVTVLVWWLGKHEFRGGSYCTICETIEPSSPCVPRVARCPSDHLTSREAAAKFGIGYDTFVSRYQVRHVPPSFVHVTKRSYFWDGRRLKLLTLSDEEYREKVKADALAAMRGPE